MMYECHITISVLDATLGEAVAKQFHWKTSQIERDPVLGRATYFYLTSHADGPEDMFRRMRECSAELRLRGVPIVREKIELILYDTKLK